MADFTINLNVDANSLVAKADLIQVPAVAITTASWTLVGSTYESVISHVDILANSWVDIIPDNDSVDAVALAEIYPGVDVTVGSAKVYAKNLPTTDIIVTLTIIKK